MKNLQGFSFLASLGLLLFNCCQPHPIPDQRVIINGIPNLSVVKPNEIIGPLHIEVIARDGLASFTIEINGDRVVQKTLSGEISFSTPFTYYLYYLDAGKHFQIDFTATDIDGDFIKQSLNFNVYDGSKTRRIESDITVDQTWNADTTYILDGRIVVRRGATLTIQKGVIVKASERRFEGDIPSGLVISRGAKIIAEGSLTQPIVFTSIYDYKDEDEGNFYQNGALIWDAGPNGNKSVGPIKEEIRDSVLMGGIIILGNSKGSFAGNVTETYLSDVPLPEDLGKYGGSNLEDNSGTLKYVFIRSAFTSGSLTLAGVGSATTIENVEVGSASDGIVIKGGNVNMKNIVVTSVSNAINISQGWSGILENFILMGFSVGFKIRGPEGSYYDKNHLLTMGNLISCYSESFFHFDEGSNTDMSKLFFWNPWGGTGINLFPNRYNPKISKLTSFLDYKQSFPPEFHPFFVGYCYPDCSISPGADLSKIDWGDYKIPSDPAEYCPFGIRKSYPSTRQF